MAEPRNLRWDIAALVALTAAIFVSMSLWSHDPADVVGPFVAPFSFFYQPDQIAYPENTTIQNWCGYWGSVASHLLIQGLGAGAFVVAGLMYLSVIAMLKRTPITSPLSRSLGWSLVILAVSTFPALVNWKLSIASPIGPGGYLGATTSTWIHLHFAWTGGLILTLSCLIAGLLLSTEYAVLHAISLLTLGGINLAGKMRPIANQVTQASLLAPARGSNDPSSDPQSDLNGDRQNRGKVMTDVDNVAAPTLKFRGKEIPAEVVSKMDSAASVDDATEVDVAPNLENATKKSKGKANKKKAIEEVEAIVEDVEEDVQDAEYEEVEAVEEETATKPTSEPRVRNKKDRNAAKDSLAHLDDTRLPEGTEEYVLPGIDLLTEADDVSYEEQAVEVRRKAKILEQTFADFGFNVKVVEIETGPVIAQYEIELEAGLRLSKITGLADDLAIALRVPSVRIVAPIPGKNTVGIEVPNETRQVVRMREVIEEGTAASKKMKIPLFLGKDVSGNPLAVDLASLPHLLIAGRTGTGKSVCLNTIITSILMTRRPDEVRMLMIDPKMVELSGYGRLPHLMHPVVTDMRKAEAILAWAVDKMEERYALLARAGVRHIVNYNQLGREELLERMKLETPDEAELIPDHLPFIVIVADEMADLMMTAGKEVEQHIIRLAQKSRAVGIHLILATQKPTVDVITGLIKSNLPARISFQVASRTDSRVVLDEMGADKLLGNGDMLFLWPGTSKLLRGQGTYVSDEEINSVVDHCSTGEQNFVNELVNLKIQKDEEESSARPGMLKKRDELYEAAIDIVVREGRGSCSLLQRALGIGYGRAARLIDFMAEDGFVGQYNGSQAREVTISISDWEAMRSGGSDDVRTDGGSSKPPAPKKNTIRLGEPSTNFKRSASAAASKTTVPVPEDTDEELWEEEDEEEDSFEDASDDSEDAEYEEYDSEESDDDDSEYEEEEEEAGEEDEEDEPE